MVGPHPVFGEEPRAKQFGQCGKIGHGVDVPFPILTKRNGLDSNYEGTVIIYFIYKI